MIVRLWSQAREGGVKCAAVEFRVYRWGQTHLMGDLKGELAKEPDVTLLPARCDALLARAGCATRGMTAEVVVMGGGELWMESGSSVSESITKARFDRPCIDLTDC